MHRSQAPEARNPRWHAESRKMLAVSNLGRSAGRQRFPSAEPIGSPLPSQRYFAAAPGLASKVNA